MILVNHTARTFRVQAEGESFDLAPGPLTLTHEQYLAVRMSNYVKRMMSRGLFELVHPDDEPKPKAKRGRGRPKK